MIFVQYFQITRVISYDWIEKSGTGITHTGVGSQRKELPAMEYLNSFSEYLVFQRSIESIHKIW